MVKFLIIRFSSIGDIVLTTPLIRCLKEQVENAEVHYLLKASYEPVLKHNPYIDKLILLKDQTTAMRIMQAESYDYIIDLQNNTRSLRIRQSLKRMYFAVDKLNVKKWLLVNFKVDKLPDKHIVDRYLDTLSVFDVKNDGKGLEFHISENDEIDLTTLPEAFQKSYIALVIGAKHETKKMPPEQLGKMISQIKGPVILIGGEEDKEAGEEILRHASSNLLINGCGQWSLGQSASLIQQSRLVITHDTGMMHIAAAFKKRVISIWGNTIPKFGMYPYLPAEGSERFEVEGLNCRPCSKIGHKTCPKKHFRCMLDQDLNKIAERANNLM